jgi:hypothetical protein
MPDCTIPDRNNIASGDLLYGSRICDQRFIDWAWRAFKFHFDSWHDGWGFNAVCNIDLPLARTLGQYCAVRYDNGTCYTRNIW